MVEMKNFKLRASSLIEVVVAMVIMVVVFGIGMMIYHNILRSGINLQTVKAELVMNEIAEETLQSKKFFDEEVVTEEFIVRKKIDKYDNNQNLLKMTVEVYSKDEKLLGDMNQLILTDE